MPSPNPRPFKLLRVYCEASAIFVVATGGLVLCGWAFHIELLKSLFPGLVAINVNMALALFLSGTSLGLLLPGDANAATRYIARFLALLVVLIGAATRVEYFLGANLRIDQLFVRGAEGASGATFPGRMSPTSATAFAAIGMALLFLEWQTKSGRRPSQGLSLWPALVALMAITEYAYHATALTKVWFYTQIPLPTAIAMFLLSGAIFFARPHAGLAGDITGE